MERYKGRFLEIPSKTFRPKVSVIIAAFNAEGTIERCLDAILSLKYPVEEVIVVDNNSKDRTIEILKSYVRNGSISYVVEKNQGWPAARNTGINQAKSSYVANIGCK